MKVIIAVSLLALVLGSVLVGKKGKPLQYTLSFEASNC
jgi:hypothetical protein